VAAHCAASETIDRLIVVFDNLSKRVNDDCANEVRSSAWELRGEQSQHEGNGNDGQTLNHVVGAKVVNNGPVNNRQQASYDYIDIIGRAGK